MKDVLKTLFLLAAFLSTEKGFTSKVHYLTIHSMSDLDPDNFKSLTGYQIDDKTVVGFDIDGTTSQQYKEFTSFHKALIKRWNDAEYTQKEYGRIFENRQDAIELYHALLDKEMNNKGVLARGKPIGKSTHKVVDNINKLGAYTLFVTARDGDFEIVTKEAKNHKLKMSFDEKNTKLFGPATFLIKDKWWGNRMDKKYNETLKKAGVHIMYRDGAIYTGLRIVKGLAMREVFKNAGIIHEYKSYPKLNGIVQRDAQPARTLIMVDDQDKNFPDIQKSLTPYFDQIYLVHFDRKNKGRKK